MDLKVTLTTGSDITIKRTEYALEVHPFDTGIRGIQTALLTAKGQLIAASAAGSPIAIDVGTPGQVLTPDPSTDSGLIWGASAGAATVTNLAGFELNPGDVVILDDTERSVVSTTVPKPVFGVVQDVIAIGATGGVSTAMGQVVQVNCDAEIVAVGDYLRTSSTATKATVSKTRDAESFAVALTAKASGVGSVYAMLYPPSPILGNPNVLMNGNFDVWQRGTTFGVIASGTFTADRWRYNKNGTMVHAVTRTTGVPTEAQSGLKSNYSLRVDCSTADAAIAATDYCYMRYGVEGYDYAPLKDNVVTLSFWVYATKTGTYCVAFRNSIANRCYVVEYTVETASTWEKKIITLTIDQTGGTEDYTNGLGMDIVFTLACGSTYQTTPNTWQNANYFATANQVNACDSTSNDFYLAQVKLELGAEATPFVPRPYQAEYDLCLRYYETTPVATAIQRIYAEAGYAIAGSGVPMQWVYQVTKRATPTIGAFGTFTHLNDSGVIYHLQNEYIDNIYTIASGSGRSYWFANANSGFSASAEL